MSADGRSDVPADGLDAGVLLGDREYIRVTTQSFPTSLVRQVLQALDERRRSRGVLSKRPSGSPLMSLPEMRREITWRLGTLPPEDAKAVAALVRQLAQQR